jgi:hypothetical protein
VRPMAFAESRYAGDGSDCHGRTRIHRSRRRGNVLSVRPAARRRIPCMKRRNVSPSAYADPGSADVRNRPGHPIRDRRSLSEVLTNLSGVIRARFRLKRKVVALSSEARHQRHDHRRIADYRRIAAQDRQPRIYVPCCSNDRTGNVLLWGCGIWMSIGILVMRQMINFRV